MPTTQTAAATIFRAAAFFIVASVVNGCGAAGDGQVTLTKFDAPTTAPAQWPNLTLGYDGAVYMSWLEDDANDGHSLRYARLNDAVWGAAQSIAHSDNWFVNWADFPSLVAGRGGMAAHWLAKREGGTYAYDVAISTLPTGEQSWSTPFTVHDDNTPTEHGFVSLEPYNDGFDVVWLDGRYTQAAAEHDSHAQSGAAAMTLRYAYINADGTLSDEQELDAMTCDCCQTDLARSAAGLVVAYRDRSADEIRDIYVALKDRNGFSAPFRLAADNWEIAGCPVNGPALAADGERVVAAWFTAAQSQPGIKIARSTDGGRSFGEARLVAEGEAIAGRVDVVLAASGDVWVSWLGVDADGATALMLRRVAPDGRPGRRYRVAAMDSARSSGFPQMVATPDELVFAWTSAGKPKRLVTGAVKLTSLN